MEFRGWCFTYSYYFNICSKVREIFPENFMICTDNRLAMCIFYTITKVGCYISVLDLVRVMYFFSNFLFRILILLYISFEQLKIYFRYSEFCSEDNRTQSAIQDFCTQASNMAGICAINIPITHSSDKLPLSLQLMCPQNSDYKLLSIAKWLEQKSGYRILKLS